ncbi:DUF6248 family natural product biosynthesis protein (plasmid) [Streptomyces albidoflavus]|uniref:Uncharacterized protein n=1 Tax=Streptomyces albidoflavus TaxID=1886 RepID=A0A8G1ZJY7_9ACTN|nr:DUF6248 family natural product biosynthesis protein [Streptomyces albidoflavus]RZE15473.1 hypothetical protein C0Q92_30980 [Streptomyces albidoflavus]WSU19593.1 DUF6248 family natural product biosynthesis protein [Streptomyces albidoflavus]CAI4198564.1 DUF6248 domain-containing protein [Streptomyces albidoflavus]
MTETDFGEPTPETCLRVARQAAALAAAADDMALSAACRSTSRTEAHREEIMHAVHRQAVEADGHAARAEQWAADPSMPDSALRHCANGAVDYAVRAQEAAGIEATAAALRTELERKLTPAEHAERESGRRRAEAEQEAEERAATGMDADNRHLARMNAYLAESAVPRLGWTAGHVRVLEAAETGRLYQRDGQVRQAAEHGTWSGGRRVSRERTQDLHTAGFLVAVDAADGAQVLAATSMGQVALELARLHPAGLYESDKAAYEARYNRVAKLYKRMDDKKAAARRLPALEHGVGRYRRPVTLVEQEARAARKATEQWEDEGGYCPGVETPAPAAEEGTGRCPCCGLHEVTVAGVLAPHKATHAAADHCPGSGLRPGADTPRPAAEARVEAAPAAAAEPAATPVTAAPSLPPGMYFLSLPSTLYREWWAIQCGRCHGGDRITLSGEWADKYEAAQVAREHFEEAHQPLDAQLTAEEIAEVERWPLSDAQRTVLHWAEHAELAEYDDGFWALDCVPDRWDVNKRVARGRVTGMWAAGLLNVHLTSYGRRLVKSPTGRRVARLVWRAERQGVAQAAAKDARLAPLPKRSNGYPLLSEGRCFKGEERRADDPAPTEPAPAPAVTVPAAAPVSTKVPVRADQPLLRRLFAPRSGRQQRPADVVRAVVRRSQRILTPEERERVRDMPLLNLQGALIMGITDPVPNPSPMPEEAGAWVREHAWPAYWQEMEDRYPFGFHRWSMCERGTCWNCLSGRHDICVHRQKGGPDVDDNRDWVTNHQGRTVAEFIPRPDGEPCVWWCRCECPKGGPAPARPAAKRKPARAGSPAAPEPAPARAGATARAPEADAVQAALW